MKTTSAGEGLARIELESISEMAQIIELVKKRSYEGIYLLWNDPHEVWDRLCDSDLHIGLRGANWGVVKDIPMLTINGVGIVLLASESDGRYGYFATDAYKVAKSIKLQKMDIIDLDDPSVPFRLAKLDGKLMGWDFETRGFPLEVGFKPLGFSLVSDNYGLYLNFRHLTDYSTDLFKSIRDFLLVNQKNLVTYNCKFEMSCFLQMFNQYIYPMDAMVILACDDVHTNLKAAAQMYLSVPSWDDELDAEMKMLDLYMKNNDESIIDQIKENRRKLDPLADLSKYESIKLGYGNAWEMCYPPALGKYCIYDSYYTLKIWEKVAPKYTEECIDIFHRNYYHGMYLSCNPMPIKTGLLEELIEECKTIGINASGYLNRIYGELLELKYGNLDFKTVIDPVHIKLIEYGHSDLINENPVKVLKAVFKKCFEEQTDGSFKLISSEPLVNIYGKNGARMILTSVTMDDIRGKKKWTQIAEALELKADTGLVRRFNEKYNSECLEYLKKFSELARKNSPLDIDILMRFRNLFYMDTKLFRGINKGYKPITDKITSIRKDKDLTDLLLSYVNKEQYEQILNSPNPKAPEMKSLKWFNKVGGDISKLVQELSEEEFSDDLVGFSGQNYAKFGEWIAFDQICDLIKYRRYKKEFDKLNEITLYEKPKTANGEYPELINMTSAPDSAKLMDLLDLNFHEMIEMNLNRSRNNRDHAVWTEEKDVYSYEGVPELYDPRTEFNPLTGASFRRFFLDKTDGANTFPIVYGSRLYKDGHYRKGREKLTLPSDPKELYYLTIQYSYAMYSSAKQLSPYLQGDKGFDTKRYKRVSETDQYTILDKAQKGDGFEVRFNIAEKSTKRSSSFYHTIPAHGGNVETKILGITDKQMSEGKVISYFDISQMEPRTLAYDSKCKNFMWYYENHLDVYKELAKAYLKNRNHHMGGDPNWEPAPEQIKEQRPRFKQLSLALLYGMGDNTLAARLGVEKSEARELRNFYFSQFPEIESYIEKARQYMSDHGGKVWTLFGDTANGQLDKITTQALNMRIQGGASLLATAGFFNTATAAKRLGFYCKPMGIIHDSCQNIVNVTDLVYMEQVYQRYFTEYCYDKRGIMYGYDLELCSNWASHIKLKPYDFDKKVLTIEEGPSDFVKYIIDSFAKKFEIETEGYQELHAEYNDPMEVFTKNMECHTNTEIYALRAVPEIQNVKIHFKYDFNDELMEKVKSMPFDALTW